MAAFATAGLLLTIPALAADQAAPAAEVITVTARKTKEDVRKVPMSISVVSSRQLQEQHVNTVAELTRAIPNLSFSSQGGEGNQNFEIRGISSSAGTSTVAVYLDDVPVTVRNLDAAGQVEPRFFDISRIEVLRGPQGTLFGASSMGGTIRYVTNPVNLYDFHGSTYNDISGTKNGGLNHDEQGVVNVPIVAGRMALRLGVEQFSDGGYIDRYNPDDVNQLLKRNVNSDHGTVVRASLVFKPIDDLTLTSAVLFQNVRTADLSVVDLGLKLPQFLAEAKRVQESENDTLLVPSFTANYDLGFADATSVTSYYYRRFDRVVDGTFYNSGFIGSAYLDNASPPVLGLDGGLDGSAIAAIPSPVYFDTSTHQLNEELRLTSKPYHKGGLPVTWIGGVYYSQQQIAEYDDQYMPGATAAINNIYGPAVLNNIFGGPFPNDDVEFSRRFFDERQYAAFADGTYYVTSRLRLSAGVRYLHAREALRFFSGGFLYGGNTFANSASYGDATTPKFAATFDVDRDSTLYATISKGFRLGGPNLSIPVSICGGDLKALNLQTAPLNYNSDKLWNYETGIKSRLLGGRLQVSADLFYIQWSGIQQNLTLPTCGFAFNENVGDATSFGAETQMRYRLDADFTLAIAAGYTHATLNQGDPSLNAQKGAQIEGVPDWNASASIEYSHPVTRRIRSFVRANWDWVGRSHGALAPTDPDYTRPAYGVLGASAGLDLGKWELAVFGTNLTNDQLIIQRPNLQAVNRGYVLQPLTLGISASTSF